MFGVAMELRVADFKIILQNPRAAIVGIISQFFLLPAITFLLILLTQPGPSIALGMILVSSCPGGNISNFMTHLARGNTALSISLTAFGTAAAIFMTPINLSFWGSLYEPSASILNEVSLNGFDMLKTIFLLAGIPLILGMTVRHYFPNFATRVSTVTKPASIMIFVAFVIVAFMNNYDAFLEYIEFVIFIVAIHNTAAIATGFLSAKLASLDKRDRRTIAIETGIQNSGLGLVLIFDFFNGIGGMAVIAAWWGLWHIISGLLFSYYWSIRVPKAVTG
jgi:BASS family bile acid:Na+ symporter